ncbi:MAG: OmpA family protein [Candidatus Methylophosphatis roskildensis]
MNPSHPTHGPYPSLLRYAAVIVAASALVACGNPSARPSAEPAGKPSTKAPGASDPRGLALKEAAATAAPTAAPAAATAAPAAPAAPPPPPPIMAFEDAVQFAANNLFAKADLPVNRGIGDRYPLVIDPLVDGNSGVQSTATQTMETRISALVKSSFPKFEIKPFNSENLVRGPLLFIGTFTPVDKEGKNAGPREWYRVCLALVDLRSGLIISKGFARASPQGIDHTPTAFFLDSPAWAPDPATQGYVKTCQGTKAGDPINPVYLDRVFAAAQINEGMQAYSAGRYDEALDIYRGVLRGGAGDQLRVHNGIYLSSWKLGRRDEAMKAFAKLVDFGLGQNRLGIKFLFRPGSTQFWSDKEINGPYDLWLRQIAATAAQRSSCVEVSGHTSRTGSEPINDRLSLMRAQYISQRLASDAPQLRPRLSSIGKGWHENIIGIGTDDSRDILDRRVEFRVSPCSAATS